MMNKFFCYSERLKNALYYNGFRIVEQGFNKKTNSKYWIFIGSEILNYYKDTIYQNERDKF